MRKYRIHAIIVVVIISLLVLVNAIGSSAQRQPEANDPSVSPPASESPSNTPPPETSPEPEPPTPNPTPGAVTSEPPETTPPPAHNLVPYNGIVEHLFFHEVIAYPELAFRGDHQQKGYDDNMVTVSEFNKMLKSIYERNYILVDMNDVWSEYTDETGVQKMKKNTLMLPEGKKPLILSFDDISFYEYMNGYGFMNKLIVGENGEIWATGVDPQGNEIVTQDLTVVTILDKFVKEHPDFSLNGVKGCIALTGYNGILGYRTQTDRDNTSTAFESNRQREIAYARPVIKKLKETGWYFASHSWGHIRFAGASLDKVKDDAQRWQNEVASLVGETKLLIYPHGGRLDGDDVKQTGSAFRYYHSLGFRVFASVGIESFSRIKSDIAAVICDRMHADGLSLRFSRKQYQIFYDAPDVFDPRRPSEYGNSW